MKSVLSKNEDRVKMIFTRIGDRFFTEKKETGVLKRGK
jgi:hypothetical protein